jgi:two-component system cell cycle sensor histidine kinase/response regulator CckA
LLPAIENCPSSTNTLEHAFLAAKIDLSAQASTEIFERRDRRRMALATLTGTPISILLLEDDPLDAELCLRKLESSGLSFFVKGIGSADEFKYEIGANKYDIVLGDYRMPNWTGLEAVRWLRASGYSIPFILLTGTLGDELAVECIKEGANDYVLKDKMERLPFALLRAVEEARMRAERDQTEHELRQTEQQYASIVRGAPYGIYRSDERGHILMANPALITMLGYESEAEFLKLNIETDVYLNPKERAGVLKQLEEHKTLPFPDVKWRRKDSQIIIVRLEGRRFDTSIDGRALYEMFVQDITERRVLEQQFQQAQKMEAIGRLAGGVAHDFNNLLMIIRGCAELLDHHKADPQKVGGYIKQINDATSIAASVVQQLMAFSRKQVPEKRALDFNAVLRDLRKMLPRLLGEDIQIVFTPGPTLERVAADRAQIEQILLNLAVNARDAMPSGGKLVLATSNVFLSTPQIETGGIELPAGSYVLLSVSDTGTGMEQDVKSHIFEPFFTTKERGKGTGLGLATVYGIVKENNGFIAVHSEMGKGSEFKIYFPVDTMAKETAAAIAKSALPVPGGSETILLVEDEAALREITCEYLQSRGYNVLSASSGMQALEICRVHEAPIDILMTDIIMPGIQGPELVKAALDMRPQMHVIYVSGYTDRGMEIAHKENNATLLQKPYSLADLGHTIRSTASQQLPAHG